jgi:hypothetical protein
LAEFDRLARFEIDVHQSGEDSMQGAANAEWIKPLED